MRQLLTAVLVLAACCAVASAHGIGSTPTWNREVSRLRAVAITPRGEMTPLVWLHDFNDRFPHPFLFTSPLTLPTGTTIHGVPPSASIGLITAAR